MSTIEKQMFLMDIQTAGGNVNENYLNWPTRTRNGWIWSSKNHRKKSG